MDEGSNRLVLLLIVGATVYSWIKLAYRLAGPTSTTDRIVLVDHYLCETALEER